MVPGLRSSSLDPADHSPRTEHVLARRNLLGRILSFTGNTIDDLTNCPVVKNRVLGYYKLTLEIDRRGEIIDLERQWNPHGRW
jgi:DNA phosphorothioation-dependent restriction protein DptG